MTPDRSTTPRIRTTADHIWHTANVSQRSLNTIGKLDSLTDRVYQEIRDRIVDLTLPPGTQVSEARLASELGVSKTPVREALIRLRNIGIVEPRERSYRVVLPSIERIRNAYELRASLERRSAQNAALRTGDKQIAVIAELADDTLRAARAFDKSQFRLVDRKYHEEIASSGENALVDTAVKNAIALTAVLRERDTSPAHDSIDCAEEHVDIADALAARDAERAGDMMEKHLLHVMDKVLAAPSADL